MTCPARQYARFFPSWQLATAWAFSHGFLRWYHLSLLGGITPKEIRKFNSKGIFTIHQLSYTFRPRRIRKRPSHYTRPHSFELQALALQNRKIYVHKTPILPHATVDIYFDIEGLPDRNFHCLLG